MDQESRMNLLWTSVCAADVAFQVTGAQDGEHEIAGESLINILDATKDVRAGKKLRLYLVVPEHAFAVAKAQKISFPKHCQEEVEQWVLAIPSSLPEQETKKL